jgi:hypothetical protein
MGLLTVEARKPVLLQYDILKRIILAGVFVLLVAVGLVSEVMAKIGPSSQIPVARPQSAHSIFEDVPEDHWANAEIEALFNAGHVVGCSVTPRLYCPDNILNRAESSVFVLHGEYGAITAPPHPTPATPTFTDVSSSFWGYGWIESLWQDGFTAGCSTDPPMYCPVRQHTRAEGSVFFLHVKNGISYEPPAPTGIFDDVDLGAWYADWVEAAYSEGILPACNTDPLQFCPEQPLDRAWAAYMMVQAKGGLPLDHPTPTPTPTPEPGAIVVDHTSVALFDSIPEAYLQAAADLHMLFVDRSVGMNIDSGLTCLSYPSPEAAPIGCRRFDHPDPTFSVDLEDIRWDRPEGYNRDRWHYQSWPLVGCHGWYQALGCYFDLVEPVVDQYEVISYQFSYLEVASGSTIEDQPGGFFWDNANLDDVYDLEAFEAQHTDKTFIYWTTSLSRSIETEEAQIFNNQMRQYAADNNKILFDVADILSHDPDGNPCYDNRDGVPYDNGTNSENYPDDGLSLPAICQHYTSEVNGGHLQSVSAGKIRVAKAFWVLMARLAGWE